MTDNSKLDQLRRAAALAAATAAATAALAMAASAASADSGSSALDSAVAHVTSDDGSVTPTSAFNS
ncbi:hypothetical protein ACQEU6_31810 [Spirillospora sp. CA-108201]